MNRLCLAMSSVLAVWAMSVLAEPVMPQQATDSIEVKAKELKNMGCYTSVNPFDCPGLQVELLSPNENLEKAIEILQGFPHPLYIGLSIPENPPAVQKLAVDLTKLCDLRVEQLSISGLRLNPSQVQCIGQMKSLIKLRVQNCPGFNDDGLLGLAKLQELELLGTDATDAGIKQLTAIKWLVVEGGAVTGVGLSTLRDLHYLRLKSSAISNDGLAVISSLAELGHLALTLGEHVDTDGLIRLSRAPRLKSLTIWELSARTKIVGEKLRVPHQFPQLSSLYINSTGSSEQVCELIAGLSGAGTESLESLSLNCRELDDEIFDHLKKYSHVPTSIIISPCRVTDAGAMKFTGTFQTKIKLSESVFVNGMKEPPPNPFEAELRRKEAELEKLRAAGRSSPGLKLEIDMLRRGERSGK